MVTLPSWLVSNDFVTCSYSVHCLILPQFPCICYSVAEHTLYHVPWCFVLFPVLGMLIWCVPYLIKLLTEFEFIIIIIIIISFMQGIYTHIPETNYVPREYGVAAILLFLFVVLISLVSVLNLLYFCISTFRIMCAVPNMAAFCSSLTSWFPGMLLTYLLLLLLLLLLLCNMKRNFSQDL